MRERYPFHTAASHQITDASVRAAQGIFSGGRQQNATWVGRVGHLTGSYKKIHCREEIIFFTFNYYDLGELGFHPRGVTHPLTSSDVVSKPLYRGCDRFPEIQVSFQISQSAQRWPLKQQQLLQFREPSRPTWKASLSVSLAWATWARCMRGDSALPDGGNWRPSACSPWMRRCFRDLAELNHSFCFRLCFYLVCLHLTFFFL